MDNPFHTRLATKRRQLRWRWKPIPRKCEPCLHILVWMKNATDYSWYLHKDFNVKVPSTLGIQKEHLGCVGETSCCYINILSSGHSRERDHRPLFSHVS